jgi:DNA-binding response OmpR family regulator
MTESLRVLVVDDEVALAGIVETYLVREGFTVDVVHDGPSALDTARLREPDLVVLDIMLPGMDGLEVCRQIRSFSDAYIIMLTARDEEVDKIIGLSVGADDYLVKPFSPRELIARVRAMLRRPRMVVAHRDGLDAEIAPLKFGALTIDTVARTANVDGNDINLTRTEFDLLATLAERPRRAFSRRQLIEAVWGEQWYGDEHIVDVHVGHLRQKLGDNASNQSYVRTVRGVGYGMASG